MKLTKLFCCILFCLLVGYAGGLFTRSGLETWYPGLVKPELNPPNWVFFPVWTLLYILMGISLFLILEKKERSLPLTFFAAQLTCNFLWSMLFFGMQSITAGLIDILFLWFFLAAMIGIFWKVDWRAAALNIPYFMWVSFATYLNYQLWMLNSAGG